LDEYGKAHPEMSEKQLEENYGSYYLWVSIEVRFRESRSIYVGVLSSETY
jgi:hypothetical protein